MELNLVPTEKIVEMRRAEVIKLLQNYLWLVIAMLLLLNLTSWFTRNQIEQKNKILSQVQVNKLELKVKEINRKLDAISKVQDSFVPWSIVLNELNRVSGPSINIRQLTLDQNTALIIINGLAQSRQNLLDYESKLKTIPFLKEINLPLESLLEKENVSFQITAKINFDTLL